LTCVAFLLNTLMVGDKAFLTKKNLPESGFPFSGRQTYGTLSCDKSDGLKVFEHNHLNFAADLAAFIRGLFEHGVHRFGPVTFEAIGLGLI
jgi:hypothetical protein